MKQRVFCSSYSHGETETRQRTHINIGMGKRLSTLHLSHVLRPICSQESYTGQENHCLVAHVVARATELSAC